MSKLTQPSDLPIVRYWEIPNKYTFKMRYVKALLGEELEGGLWIDPFCGLYSPADIKNDADTDIQADYHLDGLDFLKTFEKNSVDGVLFDPPYSVEQALRIYKPKQNGTAGRLEYQFACIREIGQIIKIGGKVICFGWDSNGVGLKRGFVLKRIMLLAHGAAHRDTIITVENKVIEI